MFGFARKFKVDYQVIPWASVDEQYTAAFAAGSPPDVFYLPDEWYPKYVNQGQIADINEIILGKKWAFGLILEDSAVKIRLKPEKIDELKWNFPQHIKEIDGDIKPNCDGGGESTVGIVVWEGSSGAVGWGRAFILLT